MTSDTRRGDHAWPGLQSARITSRPVLASVGDCSVGHARPPARLADAVAHHDRLVERRLAASDPIPCPLWLARYQGCVTRNSLGRISFWRLGPRPADSQRRKCPQPPPLHGGEVDDERAEALRHRTNDRPALGRGGMRKVPGALPSRGGRGWGRPSALVLSRQNRHAQAIASAADGWESSWVSWTPPLH